MGWGAEYWVGEDRQGEGALWPGGSKDPTPTQSSPFTHSFNALLQGTHYRSRLVLVSGGQRAPSKTHSWAARSFHSWQYSGLVFIKRGHERHES